MKKILLITVALSTLTSCKTPAPQGSLTKDIGQQGPGQTIIVFHMKNGNVIKSSCPDYAATVKPEACPTLNNTSWSQFSSRLQSQGANDAKIKEIRSFLEAPSLMHAESANIKNYMPMIDAAIMGTVVSGGSGKVSVPPPSGTDNDLDKVAVLQAMEQTRSTFNMPKGTVDACLANDVPDWSDIVIHYYCQHGQARACFTGKARQYKTQGLSGKESYEKAYDDCINDKDFKWVAQNQPDVFRYLMFSVYDGGGVKTFKQEDQDWVINKFYGVSDPTDPGECNKRYVRKNETRPVGRHCADGTPAPAGSGTVLEAGKYEGTNLGTGFCKEPQVVDPAVSNNTMNDVKVGWCGNSYSSTFNCAGSKCTDSNKYTIEVLTQISYRFSMPSGSAVYAKVGGSTSGSGSSVVLKRGSYKSSNLTSAFCKDNQIVEPVVQNSAMVRANFGWCGNTNSGVFSCQGKTCTNGGASPFTVEILSDSSYTFEFSGNKATYNWHSSSMTP